MILVRCSPRALLRLVLAEQRLVELDSQPVAAVRRARRAALLALQPQVLVATMARTFGGCVHLVEKASTLAL